MILKLVLTVLMKLDLAKALGEIEKGAERHLQVRQAEFEKLQKEMGNKQVIVGHIEKIEEPEEEEVMEDKQVEEEEVMEDVQVEKTATVQVRKATEQDDTTTKEENPLGHHRGIKHSQS